jgi:ubiquinone biosynthesis protein COQ9
MSLPQNVGSSVGELARLVDEMWFLAGDKSVDFSWYTKRATLSAVYASTGSFLIAMLSLEVFMTTDNSENFQDTWGILFCFFR